MSTVRAWVRRCKISPGSMRPIERHGFFVVESAATKQSMRSKVLLLCLLASCGQSHGTDAGFDASNDTIAADAAIGDAPIDAMLRGACGTPVDSGLVLRDGVETASLFVHEETRECAFLCAHRECARPEPAWRHVLDFEYLPDTRRTRVATRFGGLGNIAGTSEGDFVGDGLVRDVPFDVPTTIELRSEREREVEFVLQGEAAGRSVTVRRFSE